MQGARDEFLAGAALAENKNSGISVGDAFDHAENGVDFR